MVKYKSTRNTSIELLRFLFMFGIVLSHGMAHGSNLNYELIYSWGGQFPEAVHLSLFSLGKIGVTGFMFISGFYGIKFKPRSFFLLISICLFYVMLLSKGRGVTQIPIPYSRWWFIESYLLVMLFAPAIDLMFKYVEKKQILIIVGALFYYSYVGRFLKFQNSHDFIMLLTVYVLARYMAINRELKIIKYFGSSLMLLFLTFLVLVIPVSMNVLGFPFKWFCLWFQNNNLLYLLLSASLVYWCDSHVIRVKLINWMATGILAIYLLTDNNYVRKPLNHWLYCEILNFGGYLYVFLICIGCLLIDKVRQLIFDGIVVLIAKTKIKLLSKNVAE